VLRASPELTGRVRQLLDRAHADALALGRRRIEAIQAVAAALVERKALTGEEALAIITSRLADIPGHP
jgi:cell division protease FtsH